MFHLLDPEAYKRMTLTADSQSWLCTLQQHRQKGMCCLGETSMRGLAAWKVWLVRCSGNKQTPHAINMAGFYSAFVTQHPPCFAQAGLQVMKLLPSLLPCMVGVVALALIMSWFLPQSWDMFKLRCECLTP